MKKEETKSEAQGNSINPLLAADLKNLSEFLKRMLPNGTSIILNGYCNIIQLRKGKWEYGVITLGILGTSDKSIKYWILPNMEMSKENIYDYIKERMAI